MKITGWEKHQSYRKDRGQPPWIKLHRKLMRNHQWVVMTTSQRGQLVSMWLLAADNDGNLPDDPELIKRLSMIPSEETLDLEFFESQGLIERDATVTPTRRQDDSPKAEEKQRRDREEEEVHTQTQKAPVRSRGIPTREDVQQFATAQKYDAESALRFWLHYESTNWSAFDARQWQSRLELWLLNDARGQNTPLNAQNAPSKASEAKSGSRAVWQLEKDLETVSRDIKLAKGDKNWTWIDVVEDPEFPDHKTPKRVLTKEAKTLVDALTARKKELEAEKRAALGIVMEQDGSPRRSTEETPWNELSDLIAKNKTA